MNYRVVLSILQILTAMSRVLGQIASSKVIIASSMETPEKIIKAQETMLDACISAKRVIEEEYGYKNGVKEETTA
ncbi:MAG: hypothetical protein ACXABY_36380 [Candidatus Thorarchaeota archaeon]|jgi:hypothetical protein